MADPQQRPQPELLAIPLEISGLGQGLDLISDEVRVSIGDGGGELWIRKGREGNGGNYLRHTGGGYQLLLRAERRDFDNANRAPVHLHATMYLTLLRDLTSKVVRPGAGPMDVEGVGQ